MKDIYQLATCIGSYLGASGVGSLGGNLFIQDMPETVEEGTVIAMTGGVIDSANPTRLPSFQILHRNRSSANGLRKVTAINNLLNNQWNVIEGFPGRCVSFSEAGAGFKDAQGRAVFSLNFAIVTTTQR